MAILSWQFSEESQGFRQVGRLMLRFFFLRGNVIVFSDRSSQRPRDALRLFMHVEFQPRLVLFFCCQRPKDAFVFFNHVVGCLSDDVVPVSSQPTFHQMVLFSQCNQFFKKLVYITMILTFCWCPIANLNSISHSNPFFFWPRSTVSSELLIATVCLFIFSVKTRTATPLAVSI